jgi:hypothetical protein
MPKVVFLFQIAILQAAESVFFILKLAVVFLFTMKKSTFAA